MKITDRLIGDHKTFRKLIKDLDEIVAQPEKERDVKRLIRLSELFKSHMVLHAWGEDTFYYPVVRAHLKEEDPKFNTGYMDQLDREHVTVDGNLETLVNQVKQTPLHPDWVQTYKTFVDRLTRHMKEEEEQLFPFSERILGESGLIEISNELERRRSEAPAIQRHSSF